MKIFLFGATIKGRYFYASVPLEPVGVHALKTSKVIEWGGNITHY
jgi:hypothetical protein